MPTSSGPSLKQLILATVLALSACGLPDAVDGNGADHTASTSPTTSLTDDAPANAGPLGAILVNGGASFRVWAPNADAVTVQGDFGSQQLTAVGDGTFRGFVSGAQSGQQYSY